MDLFEDPIPQKTKFPTIVTLNVLANEFKLSSVLFEVKYLTDGVIHVELSEEPTAKTANEIHHLGWRAMAIFFFRRVVEIRFQYESAEFLINQNTQILWQLDAQRNVLNA